MRFIIYTVSIYCLVAFVFHLCTWPKNPCGIEAAEVDYTATTLDAIPGTVAGEVEFVLHLPLLKMYWLRTSDNSVVPVKVPLRRALPDKGKVVVCLNFRELVNVDEKFEIFTYIEVERFTSSQDLEFPTSGILLPGDETDVIN